MGFQLFFFVFPFSFQDLMKWEVCPILLNVFEVQIFPYEMWRSLKIVALTLSIEACEYCVSFVLNCKKRSERFQSPTSSFV